MSAVDFMRSFCPDLTDWQIEVLLADARLRRDREAERWHRRQWRRVEARKGEEPRRSGMHSAYRRRR